MSTHALRPTLLACALCLVPALVGAGCGDGAGPDVTIVAAPISRSTQVPFFSMGHDLVHMPYGGIGVINTGTTWSASIELVGVAEGKYAPRYDGYGTLTMSVAGVGAVQTYCQLEWGLDIAQLSVVSGGRNRADLMLSPVTGCQHAGVARFIANPSYEFDPNHRWAGSADGENIIPLYVDDLEPLSDVELTVCDEDLGQDCARSPFGIFPDLPDPPDTPWPDPATWETEAMLLPTESHGDLAAYLVVKPGMTPSVWEVRVEDEAGAVESAYLRVSNLNTITIEAP